MPLAENPRKLEPGRLGLYAPFIALAVAICAWGVGWGLMRQAVFRHMDQTAQRLAEAGYRVDWTKRSLSGFPFRLDLDLTNPRFRERSGWGLSATRLKAEAFIFSPDHWVIVAPSGATLWRRGGGGVDIAARVLRASLSEAQAHPPRLSVESLGLTFIPRPGAAPVAVIGAEGFHAHTRAGPDNQGAFRLELDGARLAGPGLLASIAAGRSANLIAEGVFSHAAALAGDSFAESLAAWAGSGGKITVRQLSLRAGDRSVATRSGALSIESGGRLKGALDVVIAPPAVIANTALMRARTPPVSAQAAEAVIAAHAVAAGAVVTLDFQAGQTTVGPVAVGPAPRVY